MNPTLTPQPSDLSAGIDASMSNQSMPTFTDARNAPAPTPGQSGIPAKQPSGFGGWLERNAQTIGGIVGGIGGEIIDPFGGGIAGAALGQGLGQALKNKTTGTTTNPFEEGAIGGASEATGDLLGKGLQLLGKGAKAVAPDVFQSAFNLSKPTARALDTRGTSKALTDYGITGSLSSMTDKANAAMDTLDQAYKGSVGTGEIDISGVTDAARKVLNSRTPGNALITDNDKNGILQNLLKLDDGSGSLPGSLDKSSAIDTMRAFQTLGHSFRNAADKSTEMTPASAKLQAHADAYLAAGQHIQDQLDKASDGLTVDDVKSQDKIDALSKISPKLAEKFKAAKTPQEIRTLMSPFYRLKTMSNITENNPAGASLLSNAIMGSAGFSAAGPLGAALALVGSPVAQGVENAARAPMTTGAAKLLNGVGSRLSPDAPKTIVGKLTGRNALGTAITQPIASQLAGGANATAPSQTPSGGLSGITNNTINSIMAPLNAAKNGSNNPAQPSLAQILQAGGTEGLSAYLAYQKQETPELTQDQQTAWTNAQNAMNDIKDFSSLYDKTAKQGTGVGQLEILGSKIPGIQNTGNEAAIKTYEDKRSEIATSLAKILGSGSGSDAQASAVEQMLPSITDSPASAAMKMNLLVQQIGQHMQTILSAPATNTPGQLTNFTGQTVPGTVGFSSFPSSPSDVNFGSL